MKETLRIFLIWFLIMIVIGGGTVIAIKYSQNMKLQEANRRIAQLEQINKLLDTREKTEITSLETTVSTEKPFDVEVLEFCVDYNTAQRTYIELLQGLLKNNGIEFPEFAYEKLLKENIQ